MGNIETIDNKRKPIFQKRQKQHIVTSRSPFTNQRKLNYSPYLIRSVFRDVPKSYSPLKQKKQKPFQPILQKQFKKSTFSQITKTTNIPTTATKSFTQRNKLDENQIQQITQRKQRNLYFDHQKVYHQNKTKCQDIIKKVRNFNDFLNQVKKKMRYQQDENNYIVSRIEENEKKSTSKSISLLLKLQNEKVELEKYKRLVQRQLSKQHSIQSISIQNKDEKQKILKINFDNTTGSQISGRSNEKNLIKEKYKEVVKKVQQLGQIIDAEDEKKRRVKNINTLMAKLQQMHSDQIQGQKQIQKMIKIDDSDDD